MNAASALAKNCFFRVLNTRTCLLHTFLPTHLSYVIPRLEIQGKYFTVFLKFDILSVINCVLLCRTMKLSFFSQMGTFQSPTLSFPSSTKNWSVCWQDSSLWSYPVALGRRGGCFFFFFELGEFWRLATHPFLHCGHTAICCRCDDAMFQETHPEAPRSKQSVTLHQLKRTYSKVFKWL